MMPTKAMGMHLPRCTKLQRKKRTRRRAAMYAAVIGVSAMVTVIGLTALTAVRVESRSQQGDTDFVEAMLYARSAIDMGLYTIKSTPSWRIEQQNGEWDLCPLLTKPCPIGNGTYSLTATDPVDGVLSDDLDEPLVLTGTGWKGNARYKLSARVHATGHALNCLDVPLQAGGNITLSGAVAGSAGGPIASNGAVSASLSTVTANVEAVSGISGGTYLGATTSIAAREMPNANAFDYYIDPSHGTAISLSAIPLVSGVRTIQDALLTPTNNPYGAANTDGIYVINCAGSAGLVIKNSRIIGTLVILDPTLVKVQQSVNWQPAVANYPALLVRGRVSLEYSNTSLIQSLISYPSLIAGLVYASDSIAVSNIVTVDGVLLAGTSVTMQGTLALTYNPLYQTTPPPGFRIGNDKVEVVAGSWKRLVD